VKKLKTLPEVMAELGVSKPTLLLERKLALAEGFDEVAWEPMISPKTGRACKGLTPRAVELLKARRAKRPGAVQR
jgi:hypothetical protein